MTNQCLFFTKYWSMMVVFIQNVCWPWFSLKTTLVNNCVFSPNSGQLRTSDNNSCQPRLFFLKIGLTSSFRAKYLLRSFHKYYSVKSVFSYPKLFNNSLIFLSNTVFYYKKFCLKRLYHIGWPRSYAITVNHCVFNFNICQSSRPFHT